MEFKQARTRTYSLISALLVSTAMAVPATSGALAANVQTEIAQATYSFDISVSSLAAGVAEIGAASGWRIAYTINLPSIDGARDIRGDMTVPAAIDALLRGTGLSYREAGENSLILIDPAAEAGQSGAAVVDPIRVEANSTQSDLPPAYAGGQVATGGRLGMLGNTDIMDAPVSITSYTSEKIADQQAQTIADVLKHDPSVRAPNSSGGMLDTYQIRGFNMNTGNSGEVSFNGVYGVAPTYRAQTGYAERIEVLKGPAALLGGMAPNSGVGGVINIVPKRAGDEDLNRVSADYGLGEQAGSNIDFSRRLGDEGQLGVRFNGGYHTGDTYVDHQEREATLGALALDYRGDDFRATLDLIDQRENLNAPFRELQAIDTPVMPDAPDGSTNVANEWEWSDVTDQSALLGGEYDLTNHLMVFGSVGGGQSEVDRLFGYPMIENAAGDTTDTVSYARFQTKRWTADAGIRGEFKTGAVNHEATFQLSRYSDEFRRGFRNGTDTLNSNIYAPVANPIDAVAAPESRIKTSETDLTGIALADTLSMWDDLLQLTVGARHQQIETDNFNNVTGAFVSSYDESVVTPMVGVVVKPTNTLSIYANYLEGLSRGTIAPDSAANAGEVMAPYVAKQIETGVKLDYGNFGATVAIFQITKPSGQLVNNVYNSDAEQRNRGIELGVFGEVMPNVRLLGGVMFLEAELTKTNSATTKGNQAVGAPEMSINLTTEWDTPFAPGLTLSGTVNHVSEQYINTENTKDIPDWTTLDLGLRYKTIVAEMPVTFRATIQNVTDEDYWAGVNEFSMVSVGAPRTALLSVTADF
ncbi:TonB-dependent siderophore receptor [Thalassospira xianhensis]|uniref:Energy transducer TonB n=1 Tax=Thalassospira xianhensis MCCC 1A02616 TaxID=1177929 RepID=A0A367U9I3_9PROT|nr:TonB-dependent receptor [Thalassospira xianhensis]RCK04977.1 energy transducer TonB [Thalassospira xianhensis MCCC 1A02616]